MTHGAHGLHSLLATCSIGVYMGHCPSKSVRTVVLRSGTHELKRAPLVFYYLSFPKDRWGSKALVTFVYVFETVQTLMITNDCFNKYVKRFGDLETLDSIQNEWLTVPVFTAIGEHLLLSNLCNLTNVLYSKLCRTVFLRLSPLCSVE